MIQLVLFKRISLCIIFATATLGDHILMVNSLVGSSQGQCQIITVLKHQ